MVPLTTDTDNPLPQPSHKMDCRNAFELLLLTLSVLRPSKLHDDDFSIRLLYSANYHNRRWKVWRKFHMGVSVRATDGRQMRSCHCAGHARMWETAAVLPCIHNSRSRRRWPAISTCWPVYFRWQSQPLYALRPNLKASEKGNMSGSCCGPSSL